MSTDGDRSFMQRAVKRSIDVVVALLALVLLSPLLLALSALVRRDSPGPVLYRADPRRVPGAGPLRMLKFRKMAAAAKPGGR